MKTHSLFIAFLFLLVTSASAQNPYIFFTSDGSNTAIEGNSFGFRLRISGAISTPISATVTTSDGTATSADYQGLNTVITIPAGQTMSAVFFVNSISDTLPEEDENFEIKAIVTTGNTSNLSNTTTYSITDDDKQPTLYSNSSFTKYEGNGNLWVGYGLSNPYNSDISFTVQSSFDTADSNDFTAVNTTLTIPAGQTLTSFAITLTDDVLVEPEEQFELTSTVTSGNTINTIVNSTVKILDNDTTPTLSIGNSQIDEG